MDFFDTVAKRHSYRGSFTDKVPSRDELRKIVEAGLAAPSGCNQQTTQFVIVDDAPTLDQIHQMHPKMLAMQQAPALIACLIDKAPPPVYQDKQFQVEDCAAAVQNMLLAITAMGYASVWVDGWLRSEGHAERIGELLGVPAEKVVRIVLPVGQPAESIQGPDKLPFEQRAWFNRYGQ
jgi:nitroreductase